ncbi:hypothetical protein NQ318_017438 [Aromia moschata]|uniref:EB domain-containing protein n=1 Tax=Aromia moschata TaxID=1265417 RepID=A0AAV8Z2K2_9CUCU|nr:hypothetical protein NQ318_017438 [Aromia moschata]
MRSFLFKLKMSKKYIALLLLFVEFVDRQVHATAELEEQRIVTYQRCLLDIHCQNVNENSFCFGNDDTKAGVCKCIEGYELLSRNRTFLPNVMGRYPRSFWHNQMTKLDLINYLMKRAPQTRCWMGGTLRKKMFNVFIILVIMLYVIPSVNVLKELIVLGDYCRTDANCLLKDGTFGNCVDGRCECKFDRQLPTEDAMSCVEQRDLGEICENDDQCSFTSNAVCRVSCRCRAGFALSRDAAIAFFDTCEENAQCSEFLQGSLCSNNTCTCQDGFHGYGSRCTPNVGIGGTCTGLEECIPDARFSDIANCIDSVCQCLPGAVNEDIGCGSSRTSSSIVVLFVCNICYLLLRNIIRLA